MVSLTARPILHVAKWVRTGHVQTDEHWMFSEVVPNRLAAGEER
jgi:hypothetical protein